MGPKLLVGEKTIYQKTGQDLTPSFWESALTTLLQGRERSRG
jgi:hypothetical protein